MRVRQTSKRDIAERMHERYLKAKSRAEKGELLDEMVELMGCHRGHAQRLLRGGPPRTAVEVGLRRRGRAASYGPRVTAALKVASKATGWICGKRLAAALPRLVPALEAEGAIVLDSELRAQLLRVSPATIDRRLAEARRKAKPRGLPTTKPGSLLKQQIPVRTYTPWDQEQPGFLEIDLVAHCGESTDGTYCCTLDAVDIATGWTECEPVLNKGQLAVHEALERIQHRLPFPLLGIDSDNDSEFINAHLKRYCDTEGITFTRGRAYHKDDQAHIEQKNYTAVRLLVGYGRYEGPEAVEQLRRIYALSRLHINGWLPVMKLIGKECNGSRVTKHYDEPTTPFERALALRVISAQARSEFETELRQRGPLGLKRRLDAEIDRLWRPRVGGTPTSKAAS